MNSSEARSQARVQFAALAAAGNQRFPTPEIPTAQTLAPLISSARTWEQVLTCTACSLCTQRKRVVATQTVQKMPYFALADYPDAADELESQLFQNEQSGSLVIHRLLSRLNITKSTHLSYALKCVPVRGIPTRSIEQCSANLALEIKTADPRVIFAFGMRAAQALCFLGAPIPNNLENTGGLAPSLLDGERRIFVLPSCRELQMHPEWRAGVWSLLKEFQETPV